MKPHSKISASSRVNSGNKTARIRRTAICPKTNAGYFITYYSAVPFTDVSVMLSDPGTYVPANCALAAGALDVADVDVVDVAAVEVVLDADALAMSGFNAAITLAAFEFAT
jgi:hypothetical protein